MVLPDYKKGSIVNLMSSIEKAMGGKPVYNPLPQLPPKMLKKYNNDFKSFVRDDGSSPYDVGYFMAWSDLVRYKKDEEKS